MAYTPNRRTKYRITRAYNKATSEQAREGKEKYGWTDGRCLDEARARAVADHYRKAGLAYKMTIRQKLTYDRFLGATVIPNQETTLYARPENNTVDSALLALAERKERFISGGTSSTGNEITEEGPICIKIYLVGRSKGDKGPIDYQERMAWLIQNYGSKNAVEEATGIPRRTQTRVLQDDLYTKTERRP
jgi:hypothetical protein